MLSNINQMTKQKQTKKQTKKKNKKNRVLACESTTSFRDLVELLVQTKEHRLFVVDHENKPTSRVTLTDIIDTFYKIHSKDSPFSATLDDKFESRKDYDYMS
jgi:CBS-domain-containing membrane protein